MAIQYLTHEQCVMIAARVWCDPLLHHRVMDNVACEELALHIERIFNPVDPTAVKPETFERELAGLLNKYSMENGSDTPDFILAEYLISCLNTWDTTCALCRKWGGLELEAANSINLDLDH